MWKAESYDSWYDKNKQAFNAEKDVLLNLPDLKEQTRILDVGCGTGKFSYEFKKLGLEIFCLDISREMLDFAKSKRRCIYYILADAEHLPFKDNAFDKALVITVLEFVNSPEKVVREMFRVSNAIIIAFLNKYSFFFLTKKIKSLLFKSSFKNARFFSKGEISSMIENAGGKVEKTKSTLRNSFVVVRATKV